MPPVSQPPNGASGHVCVLRTATLSGTAVNPSYVQRFSRGPDSRPRLSLRAHRPRQRTGRRPLRGNSPSALRGFLLRFTALGATKFFAGQFHVESLAAIDANLTTFVFSAHDHDC